MTPTDGLDREEDGTAKAALSPEEVGRLRLVLLRLARQIRTNSTGDVTPSQLAEAVVAQGFAERILDPTDRRRVRLALSSSGEQLLSDVRRAGIGWLAPRLDELSLEDLNVLRAVLPVLEQLLATQQ